MFNCCYILSVPPPLVKKTIEVNISSETKFVKYRSINICGNGNAGQSARDTFYGVSM